MLFCQETYCCCAAITIILKVCDGTVDDTGKDATEDFEEIGHSNAAKEMLAKYVIGDFDVSVHV